MKIREGFVSNSSSSSFVLLGIKRTTQDINSWNDLIEKYDLQEVYDENIAGFHYFSSDDCGEVEETQVSLADVQKSIDKLKQIFGEDADIKWFSGMEAC